MPWVTTDEVYLPATRFPKGATVEGDLYLGEPPKTQLQREVQEAIGAGLIVEVKKRRGRAPKAKAEDAAETPAE